METKTLIEFVRDTYQTHDFIPLHAPQFHGNEQAYVADTLDSTFVSSVGRYVDQFEQDIARFTNSGKAVATVNGTAALHAALYQAGVRQGDIVITQALTFVATCNTLFHMGAEPLFVDINRFSFSLCPQALAEYLAEHAFVSDDGQCVLRATNQVIRAILPMHTFGHPAQLDELLAVCQQWHLVLVEDAAESLGSYYKDQHTGTLGGFGALSFNGNKIITTGGGGMVLCRDQQAGEHLKHLTTTAKVAHPYEFYHDEAGFNYRMPNLNAALGCAQLEQLPNYLVKKRELAMQYLSFFESDVNFREHCFVQEPEYAQSNYWLNAIVCPDLQARDQLLAQTNQAGVMTRPVWQLMHTLPMYQHCLRGELTNSEWYAARLVNLPSSPVLMSI
ncbi:aminotransferase DegT [Photobacterium jeanii]|uniref:Aminotransferase DegT n=1 Tax=Photobacterium jeanii TaxID=858640 RepID=A0A178KA34_9GAMM|nr:LegC family aminotransferase [Photobacterium jeanii]OAN13825.1 aminotransferase DegT [Photobacterium jeanii]PST88896.1 aminotransferase DegT [Photobacterium jeanii]